MALDNSVSQTEPSRSSGDAEIVLFHSTADELDAEDYHFTKTDPRSVFVLAMGAACYCVFALAAAHWLMVKGIEEGLLPPSPALQHYVERGQ